MDNLICILFYNIEDILLKKALRGRNYITQNIAMNIINIGSYYIQQSINFG